MGNNSDDTTALQIAKEHIAPMIARLGMVQNELTLLFDLPPLSAESDAAAAAWWEGLDDEQRHRCRGALAAVAAPMLIADVGIMSENERMTTTHAVLPSLRWNDPAYLFASADGGRTFRLTSFRQTDTFTNTLLLTLGGLSPVLGMELKFECPVRDLAVLLAIADLRQRLRYKALLDHDTCPESYRSADIAAAVIEGFTYPDPRWLLPFCLPALHLSPEAAEPDSTRQSLDRLANLGLLKREGDVVILTEPGERFAESAAQRHSMVRIDTYGVDTMGRHGRQSIILIRGWHFLWYAGLSGPKPDTFVVTPIGAGLAETLLKELFTPVAAPIPADPARPPFRGTAPAPAYAMPAPGTRLCPACGKPVAAAKKFCGNCGHILG